MAAICNAFDNYPPPPAAFFWAILYLKGRECFFANMGCLKDVVGKQVGRFSVRLGKGVGLKLQLRWVSLRLKLTLTLLLNGWTKWLKLQKEIPDIQFQILFSISDPSKYVILWSSKIVIRVIHAYMIQMHVWYLYSQINSRVIVSKYQMSNSSILMDIILWSGY